MADVRDYEPQKQIKIEDPELKEIAQHVLNMTKLEIIKGTAHFAEPQKYPLPSDTSSIEHLTVNYLKQLKQPKQDKAKENVQQFLEQPLNVRENLFGSLSKVDFSSNISIEEQVHKKNLAAHLKLKPHHLHSLEFTGTSIRVNPNLVISSTDIHIHDIDLGNQPVIIGHTHKPVLDPIEKKYKELGGKNGFLGKEVGGRGKCPDGKGKYQHYQNGSIYWSPTTGAHEVHGLIRDKWKSLGWETSFLGYPLTDELKTPDGKGRFNHFQGGSIYWSPETGAHEVHGAIRSKWSFMGWERSYLGYPTTDELKTPDTIGRFNHFQGGSIYWTPELGAHAVHKNIRDEWEHQGWELGFLGYPISDTMMNIDMVSTFQGGSIIWNSSTKTTKIIYGKTKLRFRIHRVLCLDETDECSDSDEIDMGGSAVSVNNGAVTKIKPFPVSHDFDEGEEVVYSPPKDFFTFNLKDIPGWPKTFAATVVLAEIDFGGFNDFLNELIKRLRDRIVNLVIEKTTELVGAALSTLIGAVGSIVGAIIGEILGWLIGQLIDWLISLPEDDIFPCKQSTFVMVIPSAWHTWSGYTNSPDSWHGVKAHGGWYRYWFDWELLA